VPPHPTAPRVIDVERCVVSVPFASDPAVDRDHGRAMAVVELSG